MEMPFHQQQLDWMVEFLSHRVSWLNPVFLILNYFDTEYFFFLLIPIIWVGFSSKWGIRIFYLFSANAILNGFVKSLLGWPRPSQDIPELGLFHFKTFGFPSGAAQTALLLGGLLIYYWKKRPMAAWTIASIYILVISFSRIYLGVHYPTDILGGWVIGLIVLILFILTIDPIEKFLASRGLLFSFFLSLAIPIAILGPFPKYHYMLGSFLGAAVGIYFSLKYRLYLPSPKKIPEGILRSLIAVAILALIFFLWPSHLPHYTRSFAAALWISLGASPLCRYLINRPRGASRL